MYIYKNTKAIFLPDIFMKQDLSPLSVFILIISSCITWFIGGFFSLISFFTSFFLYASIAYIVVYVWKKLRKKEIPLFPVFILNFSIRLCMMLWVVWGIVFSFCYYHNDIAPAYIPSYTLSNGEQTIYFQTMSHIGSPQFYEWVQERVRQKKEELYTLFYEWVRPGSPESEEIFRQALGVELTSESYTQLSDLYGVVAQNNNDFLGYGDTPDINVDLDLDTVIDLYKQQVWEQGLQADQTKPIVNIEADLLTRIENITPKQKKILQYINQAIMNLFIKNENLRQAILKNFWSDIFRVILDDRNKHLVQEIEKIEYDKIVILYGLLHFEWTLRLLQENDPNWKIIETQQHRLISQDL